MESFPSAPAQQVGVCLSFGRRWTRVSERSVCRAWRPWEKRWLSGPRIEKRSQSCADSSSEDCGCGLGAVRSVGGVRRMGA